MCSARSLWRSIPLAAIAASLFASVGALAHTTILAQATEGTRADNALRVSHGCEERDVRAQSAVFPTDLPQLAASDPAVVIGDLGEVIEQGSLAGLFRPIQDTAIFARQGILRDANENAVGFFGSDGRLDHELSGRVPFEFTAPNFVASSCAARLVVEVAIADLCKPRLRAHMLDARFINLWIPANGSQLAIDAAAAGIDGVGAPARLTVNRNLATKPLAAGCGAGYTLTVTPSPEQVDRDLRVPGRWR
jgi:hypothetical protein